MFPSTLSTFNQVSGSDRLNNPSHSALHNTVSSALGQVEAVIGLSGNSSTLGTIIGDLRSPDSNGGGHVQTANKGGTGQTSYTKGDLLVASSSSVLAKLAVGVDGQQLISNSSVASGVQWVANTRPNVMATSSVITVTGVTESSIASGTLSASILSTSNVVETTTFNRLVNMQNGASILFRGTYGGANVASVMVQPTVNGGSISGVVQFNLFNNGAVNSQRGVMIVDLRGDRPNPNALSSIASYFYDTGTSSVNSTISQPIGITVRKSNLNDVLSVDGSIIKQIT